jgi:hypothetical protein
MSTHRGCPFYGFHRSDPARALVAQGGNQCAAITTSYSPCLMERDLHTAPDWDTCPYFNSDTEATRTFLFILREHYTIYPDGHPPMPFQRWWDFHTAPTPSDPRSL